MSTSVHVLCDAAYAQAADGKRGPSHPRWVIATTILAFKLYTQVAIMTQGGPENATITSVYYLVQQGFSELHVGYASAIAVIFFLIVLVISILQRTIIKEEGQG